MTRSFFRFPSYLRAIPLLAMAWGTAVPPAAAVGSRIVVIKSKALPPFDQAVREFKRCIAAKNIAVSYEELVLPPDGGQTEEMFRALSAKKPDLVLTLGGQASRIAREKQHKTPSVFCMVLDPGDSGLDRGGVSLDVRPADFVDYLRRNFPQLKKIGILYNPLKSKETADSFRSLGGGNQTMVFEEVTEIGQLDGALHSLKAKADCLVMIADSSIYTPQTASQIILQTIQMNLPFIALSGAFVKAGALAAIYADAGDNGCQAADLAERALQGENPAEMPLLFPHKLSSAINLVVADRLSVPVSQATRSAAEQTIQ